MVDLLVRERINWFNYLWFLNSSFKILEEYSQENVCYPFLETALIPSKRNYSAGILKFGRAVEEGKFTK